MNRSGPYKPTPPQDELVTAFLKEMLATVAGVEVDEKSIQELEALAATKPSHEVRAAVRSFLESLAPYGQFGDFFLHFKTLRRPRPLTRQTDPGLLSGRFRAWLRKQGIDPDTLEAKDN